MKAPAIKSADISKPCQILARIRPEDVPPLPPPYEDFNNLRIYRAKSGEDRRP